MRCPRCKTENLAGSLLCVRCGASLSASSDSSQKIATTPVIPAPLSQAPTTPTSQVAPQVQSAPTTPSAPFSAGLSQDVQRFEEGSKYQPSGRMNASGLPMMIAAALLGALVVGVVSGVISRWINLIFISPLLTGLGAGAILSLAIASGKVRNPKLAGAVAVVMALLTLGTMHFTRAMMLRGDMVSGLTQSMMGSMPPSMKGKDGKMHAVTPAERGQMETQVQGVIEHELTPWRTLVFYEEIAAQAGTSISHNGVGTGVPVKGNFYWLLRAVEAGALLLACVAVASGAAAKPFCEACDGWHKKVDILKVHPTQNAELWQKIGAKDWDNLLKTPVGQTTDSKNLTTLSVTSCEKCGSGTLDATSTKTVPNDFKSRQISPESTRFLRDTPATPQV